MSRLKTLLGDLDVDTFIMEAKQAIKSDVDYHEIISDMMDGLKIVGTKYENGEYCIADLIVSGIATREVFNALIDRISTAENPGNQGIVLIGTAEDDIHDIGKNLVRDIFKIYGYKVIDLGVNISNDEFIREIKKYKPDILAISCVMLSSLRHVMSLCNFMESNEEYDDLKIIVGGAAAKKELSVYFQKPYFAVDMFDGLQACLNNEKDIEDIGE